MFPLAESKQVKGRIIVTEIRIEVQNLDDYLSNRQTSSEY